MVLSTVRSNAKGQVISRLRWITKESLLNVVASEESLLVIQRVSLDEGEEESMRAYRRGRG